MWNPLFAYLWRAIKLTVYFYSLHWLCRISNTNKEILIVNWFKELFEGSSFSDVVLNTEKLTGTSAVTMY